MHTPCSKYFVLAYSLLHSTWLNYLAGQTQVNMATNDCMSYPFCHLYPFMCVANLTDFISDAQVTHFITDTKLIWNSIWAGRSKMNITKSKNTIFAGTTQPERKTMFQFSGRSIHRFSDWQRLASQRIELHIYLPVFSHFVPAAICHIETHILPRF